MHATVNELLSLAQGEAAESTASHVAACSACQGELVKLRSIKEDLIALPLLPPPNNLWPAIRHAHEVERWRQPLIRAAWLTAAATVLFTMTMGVRGGVEMWREAKLNREVKSLVTESQRLEETLRSTRQGRVLKGSTANAVGEIEDQIAVIDSRLAQRNGMGKLSEDVVDLWLERVRLLDALANVQSSRATYIGL